MVLMGDEVRRSQRGNNNAYCQDNEISWFDWSLLERHSDVQRFLTLLLARRLRRDVSYEERRFTLTDRLREASFRWHGVKLDQPDWGDCSHSFACGIELPNEQLRFHMIVNAFWEPLEFELPAGGGQYAWRRWIDTALDSPRDIVPWESAELVNGREYRTEHRSVVVLIAGPGVNHAD
jgi:glycogen operon protein